jgi:diguanylate cyclase (GGDEF)-like protein/PAS domain S-box-containing protein
VPHLNDPTQPAGQQPRQVLPEITTVSVRRDPAQELSPVFRAARSTNTFYLLMPVMAIVLLGIAAFIGIVSYLAAAQDRSAAENSATIVRSSLDVERQRIAGVLDGYAWWDEAVRQVTSTLDPRWLDDNFGNYQFESHGIAASFVIDSEDKTIVAFFDGKVARADTFDSLKSELGRLVNLTRNSSLSEPVAATGFALFKGTPMIVGVEAITPENRSQPWPAGIPRFVLAFARPADQALLDQVAARAAIRDLHFLKEGEKPLPGTLALAGRSASLGATLTWLPPEPARDLALSLVPFAVALAAAMAALLWWFLRHVNAVADVLRRQSLIIEQIRDAVISTDLGGVIDNSNAGAIAMFSYAREQIIGKRIEAIYPDLTPAAVAEAIETLRAGRESVVIPSQGRKKDGTIFPARVSLFAMRNQRGALTGMACYGLDASEQRQLEAKLEEQAVVDELTGAYNRRYLLKRAPSEIERARRFKRDLTVMFLDIDHFKQVNDRFGHQFGDEILRSVAELCRRSMRAPDILVRYGGDEFVILLPETNARQALEAAVRLAAALRSKIFSEDPPYRGITVSIGISALREGDKEIDDAVSRADRAAYRAKELGRNRIELAE